MKNKNVKDVTLFEKAPVRRIWNEQEEKWYFSVIDVIGVLSQSSLPKRYWSDLKDKLKTEGSQVYDKIVRLKILAEDKKIRETDVADTETILRLIQSIPSPKAEPFKLWLARVGYERIQEINDPEKALNRSREYWLKHGRDEKWIQQRMVGQETRNKLTGYSKEHDVREGPEFAILTNIIHEEWSDLTVKNHKNLKNLEKFHNLRDHMNEAELILTALAEFSTRQIAVSLKADGLEENKIPAKKGGQVARHARQELELETGKSVITDKNYLSPKNPKRNFNINS